MITNYTMPITEIPLTDYDTNGAMIYIIIVLLWYSTGIAFTLGIQISTRSEEIEHYARHRRRFLLRNLRDHYNTKQILEELVDRQNRDRLWDIYLGTTSNKNDHLNHAENIRIRHIEKQLATIRLTHDKLYPSTKTTHYVRSHSDYQPRLHTLRRRSSLDQ